MMKTSRLLPTILATSMLIFAAIAGEDRLPDHRAGSLEKDEPQAVYTADPNDAWNRIFYCLFTRTVRTRLSDDFPEGKPFERFRERQVSRRSFERIEGGDRGIEPLYPLPPGGAITETDGAWRAITEPTYSKLKTTLEDALQEKVQRPPLARALMQSDVWAAYDNLARNRSFEGDEGKQRLERRNGLLKLLARFIKKLALPPEEIKALPDNYAAARPRLPDLFGTETTWLEIRWSVQRIHDDAADYRRAARVFIKPTARPKDRGKFVNSLRHENAGEQLEAVALVMQNLLIDNAGKVVPTPLTYEVQVRTFTKDKDVKVQNGEAKQFELSRRLLLQEPKSGGFVASGDQAPIYLSDGGEYSFASVQDKPVSEPILVRLATRCTSCHGKSFVRTLDPHLFLDKPMPPVTVLKPSKNDHTRYVAERKTEREDFKELIRRWNSSR
jgi:hypothetical protein